MATKRERMYKEAREARELAASRIKQSEAGYKKEHSEFKKKIAELGKKEED